MRRRGSRQSTTANRSAGEISAISTAKPIAVATDSTSWTRIVVPAQRVCAKPENQRSDAQCNRHDKKVPEMHFVVVLVIRRLGPCKALSAAPCFAPRRRITWTTTKSSRHLFVMAIALSVASLIFRSFAHTRCAGTAIRVQDVLSVATAIFIAVEIALISPLHVSSYLLWSIVAKFWRRIGTDLCAYRRVFSACDGREGQRRAEHLPHCRGVHTAVRDRFP